MNPIYFVSYCYLTGSHDNPIAFGNSTTEFRGESGKISNYSDILEIQKKISKKTGYEDVVIMSFQRFEG